MKNLWAATRAAPTRRQLQGLPLQEGVGCRESDFCLNRGRRGGREWLSVVGEAATRAAPTI